MIKNVDWRKRIPKRVPFHSILPNELVILILRYCGARDIGKLARVCWAFNNVAQDNIISNIYCIFLEEEL